MIPLRKNVAIALDGGGIRGLIPARALAMLEQSLGTSSHEIFRLAAGTSTGSIIAAGIACGLSAETISQLYLTLGREIFRKSLRTAFWYLFNHRYPAAPLQQALNEVLGDRLLGDLWKARPPMDLVVTAFDVIENRTRFIKSWKPAYQEWPIVKAVLASAAAPTYFPSVDGRFIDGGIGSFNNPCYLAAYEILFCLKWKPEETTLISLGTGRHPIQYRAGQFDRYLPIQWVTPLLDAFSHSADDQQVHLVTTFFQKLDFRRYQVDLETEINLDESRRIPDLVRYGDILGRMLLGDRMDRAMEMAPVLPRPAR